MESFGYINESEGIMIKTKLKNLKMKLSEDNVIKDKIVNNLFDIKKNIPYTFDRLILMTERK